MGLLSLLSVALADLLVLFGYPFQTADLIGAALISLVIFITVVPLAHYAGCILLQARDEHLCFGIDYFRNRLNSYERIVDNSLMASFISHVPFAFGLVLDIFNAYLCSRRHQTIYRLSWTRFEVS